MHVFDYQWQWQFSSPPKKLWPWVSDTDRFNHDVGLPNVEVRAFLANARKLVGFRYLGVDLEWEEEPFEWTWPTLYGVIRRYTKGPVAEIQVSIALAKHRGGTSLTYRVKAVPRTLIGMLAIPVQVGLISRFIFKKTIERYDSLAKATNRRREKVRTRIQLSLESLERVQSVSKNLRKILIDTSLVSKLIQSITTDDEFAAASMRPYAYADLWRVPRKRVLELFLHATRLGLLEFEWDVLCPMCRGAKGRAEHLEGLTEKAHCDSCNVDFTANFERYVELTFHPNPSIRPIRSASYCVGGPMLTPHIIFSKRLEAGRHATVSFQEILDCGSYRLRIGGKPGYASVNVTKKGKNQLRISLQPIWLKEAYNVNQSPKITFDNPQKIPVLVIFERTAWSDTVTTAADVTTLQTFRDLFSSEALRPGERISVGSLAIVFTDLAGSTKLYRTIGDAPAFGHVLNHFDVLKVAIRNYDGAIVKTIGDAVMATFHQPLSAIKAMLAAQQKLISEFNDPELRLKAGIHFGPAIAVTLNERLDYFGTTVNLAARLEGQASGNDLIITDSIMNDPQVIQWMAENKDKIIAEKFKTILKGFEEEVILTRVKKIT